MTKRPYFSIAIPTYNRAEDLKIAINSLLLQTLKDFEIVISDNASADDTKKVVKSFKDPRIKYFRNHKTIDIQPNVKRAIERSKGKYVFLHGDDDYIIEKSALNEIHKIISKTKVGYIRLNYLSLSSDKKHIFDFRASKGYHNDIRLKPNLNPLKIIEFLLKADPSFLTGIVFKNDLPSYVNIINSELYSWFPIIFYSAQKRGAYYVNTPFVVAGWSKWKVREDNFNPLYSLKKGKLTSEFFFNFVKSKIDEETYKKFLREQLKGIYVNRFTAIKLYTGNKNLLKLASRLVKLEPDFRNQFYFRTNLLIALLAPRILLNILRRLFLAVYIRRSIMNNHYS